jgi:uncharacterized protein (DUF1015 family)
MRIKPFKALHPPCELAAQVAAVPYDVVDTREAAELAQGNPWSFLHVTRPEIDLPPGTDPHGPATYRQASEAFRMFRSQMILLEEPRPCYYLYRLVMDGRMQTGLVACCAVDDYREEIIKTHEKTRQDKEDDRTHHIDQVNAHDEPIFITYRDRPEINAQVAAILKTPPLYDFTPADGIRNTLWRVEQTESLTQAFACVPVAYIADGHHRSAASVRIAVERRKHESLPGLDREYNWFMAVIFPAGQLKILPYNRCVRDLNGLTSVQFLDRLREAGFRVTSGGSATPDRPGQVSVFLDGQWLSVAWPPVESRDPIASLDVTVLQERLLAPILGIRDPRTDQRIEFVGGIRGTGELEERVRSGRSAVAFSMYPTQVEQMMAIADAGQIMPPKSTWFEPKLRSGLFVHALD